MPKERKYHEPLGVGFDTALTAIANAEKPTTLYAKPFLKWVGGKRSVLPELVKRMPPDYKKYNEPFLGGGALYFEVQPKRAYLSDINFHLIITFNAVRDDVDRLIRNLKIHEGKHSKEYYAKARKRLFTEKDPTKIAGLFIYLNKTCFNGLYRVNKSGQFNVPMGDYKNPLIVDEDNLYNCSQLLQGAEVAQHDFLQMKPTKGDFFYLDPPYHESYSQYDSNGFGDEGHKRLALFAREIDKKGGYFMVSNSDTPFVRELYKGYTIEVIRASRTVSCKAHQRGKENELIIRNYANKQGE
ncbi:MAG: modification methylase [Candidatus Colwellbacteria bacterium CG10_big_fil_rev_8_21_14_0_10_42_22]|uniref:site-specific DNA-methyltransferase (adenine-specific) n=1 Tax=Candidatus Colwellbacteria bacterium CG10_big_fil_rev_8_21_14_0_10_42_22 TaxID=1974540 RepID=A0A2H0VFX6_9BACT|nr:MAG: modification methylase [Candidatus Colwellbacteria bacterium CG10_big_fil_rev_8_21_14_0_10_42_22]